MIADDKEWIMHNLEHMKRECVMMNGNNKRIQEYGGRIQLIDRVIEFVKSS